MIAVCCPMPPMKGIGIRKPNRARLGMVCPMLARPRAQRRARGSRGEQDAAGDGDGGGDQDGAEDEDQMLAKETDAFLEQILQFVTEHGGPHH